MTNFFFFLSFRSLLLLILNRALCVSRLYVCFDKKFSHQKKYERHHVSVAYILTVETRDELCVCVFETFGM